MFGAGVMYFCWCMVQLVAANPPKKASEFKWGFALDSMGWLYVAAGMAVPCAIDCFRHHIYTSMSIGVCFAGAACLLLLLAGMNERAKNDEWEPSRAMLWVAGFLAFVVLFAGYKAHESMVRLFPSSGEGAGQQQGGEK